VPEYTRGKEWWLLRNDGSWLKWNGATLAWDPQPEPPPPDELTEVQRRVSSSDGEDVEGVEPMETATEHRARLGRTYRGLARSFHRAGIVMLVILLVLLAAILWAVLEFFDMFFDIG
jgi:hypothetical protein